MFENVVNTEPTAQKRKVRTVWAFNDTTKFSAFT